MQASTIFLVMVIVVIISVNYYVKNKDVVTIKSNIDGRMYRIADTPDKQQVADLLANVNKRALKLVDKLKKNGTLDAKRKPIHQQGTYGKAFGNLQKALFAAYRDTIMETASIQELMSALDAIPGVKLLAQTMADQKGVAIRAGHHCNQPLLEKLGVPATARASFSFYNNESEIDRFIEVIHQVRKLFL